MLTCQKKLAEILDLKRTKTEENIGMISLGPGKPC